MNPLLPVATAALTLVGLDSPTTPDDETPAAEVIEVEGVFDDPEARVVTYSPTASKAVAQVLEAIEPGPVARGQVLARLCSEALDAEIRRAELDLAQSRQRLARQRETAQRAAESLELKVLGSELRLADARRELAEKVTINVPQRLQSSEEGVRNWDVVRGERELEFQVLVDMYHADDLLETTERMDIEQQRRRLDSSLLRRPNVFARHEILRDVTLPFEVAKLELAVREVSHALDVLRSTGPVQIALSGLELAQAELALAREERTLRHLHRDRDALTITAPADGYAVAGRYRGEWSALDETALHLRAEATVSPGQVLFTIVRRAPRTVLASIPEAMLFRVRVGQDATLSPTSAPHLRLPATVTRVVPYPVEGRCAIELHAGTSHKRLFPGSTCRVRLTSGAEAPAPHRGR